MSCESWLVGLEGIQKCQIFQLIISLHFWGVSNYFEISNFVFSDIFSWGGSVCKILTLHKAQKIIKFRFLPLQLIFLKFGLKTYGTLKVFLLSAQNNIHITLTSYLEEHRKKIHIWITCLWLVSRPPKCRCFFAKFTVELVWKPFSDLNNSLKPHVFRFSNSLPYALGEWRELWILISWFWVRCKIWIYFCVFDSTLWIYWLLWIIFTFLILYIEEFQFCLLLQN